LLSEAQPLESPKLPVEKAARLKLPGQSDPISDWVRTIPEPKFARFAEWAERYAHASEPNKMRLEAEGVALARKRRDEMSDLIQSHPERALQLAVPFKVRQELPPSVTVLLEKQVSAWGLGCVGALAAPGHEGEIPPVYRTATIDDVSHNAFVYGRRLGELSRENIPSME
jgi:hypothetical protein